MEGPYVDHDVGDALAAGVDRDCLPPPTRSELAAWAKTRQPRPPSGSAPSSLAGMPNRLAESASPYLLTHAHEAIDWWEWSPEAWAEAVRRDVPVLVSLGYHACHWCHVMREESFDDPQVAEKLNAGFVAIKVDREERPDVDAVFMTATQALMGRGGWPNTVFCTPTGEPFFAGTYFPAEARDGLPAFTDLLDTLSDAWTNRRDEVLQSGADIVAALRAPDAAVSTSLDLHRVREQVGESYDPINGGFGPAPKFPMPTLLDALLVTGEPNELEEATYTLEAMARGGIHDQVGGGFHRYATDPSWKIPHFEKMLYDNALLLGTYTAAWRRTPDHDPVRRARLAGVVENLVAWLVRDLRLESGAFAASLDADSVDVRGAVFEGIYYVWNQELLVDALGAEDGEWAAKLFHVTYDGTFEGGLSTLMFHGQPDPERLERVRARLLEVRAERFAPARDDEVVAAWNGLLIESLVRAAMIFGRRDWLDVAAQCAEATWGMFDGDRLARTVIDGRRGAAGVLEDYAALALGYARLSGATGEGLWLERATTLLDRAQGLFAHADGGWWDAEPSTVLYDRPRALSDSATPSGTATMVAACRLVGLMTGREDLLALVEPGLDTLRPSIAAHPVHAGWGLREALITDEGRRGLKPAVVTVTASDPMAALARAAWRMAPDGSAVVLEKGQQERVVVCRGTVCFEPVTALEDLKDPLWRRC